MPFSASGAGIVVAPAIVAPNTILTPFCAYVIRIKCLNATWSFPLPLPPLSQRLNRLCRQPATGILQGRDNGKSTSLPTTILVR